MTTFHNRTRRPYQQQQQQQLCHYPTIKSQDLWQQHSYKHDTIAEPLYRLRLSALNNKQNCPDCPSRIFIYPTLETFTNAANEIHDSFGGSHPRCEIQYPDPRSVIAGVEDEDGQRMRSVVLLFDPLSAEEGWIDFVARLERMERGWTVEVEDGVR